jgi:hypothetical protein
MRPEEVKLSLKKRLLTFIRVMKSNPQIPAATVVIALILLPGICLSMYIPPFMMGPISNFFMTILLSIVISALFAGSIFVLIRVFEKVNLLYEMYNE